MDLNSFIIRRLIIGLLMDIYNWNRNINYLIVMQMQELIGVEEYGITILLGYGCLLKDLWKIKRE